jgi:hypothetical protein
MRWKCAGDLQQNTVVKKSLGRRRFQVGKRILLPDPLQEIRPLLITERMLLLVRSGQRL